MLTARSCRDVEEKLLAACAIFRRPRPDRAFSKFSPGSSIFPRRPGIRPTNSRAECIHGVVTTIHGATSNLNVFTELKTINACLPVVNGVAGWLAGWLNEQSTYRFASGRENPVTFLSVQFKTSLTIEYSYLSVSLNRVFVVSRADFRVDPLTGRSTTKFRGQEPMQMFLAIRLTGAAEVCNIVARERGG